MNNNIYKNISKFFILSLNYKHSLVIRKYPDSYNIENFITN